jgi:peptidoglycan/xylan/chitin deacetylase (PgdA/CDA1 family)
MQLLYYFPITFDDDWKDQFLYVKPTLDKYGFKATFFVTLGYMSYQNASFCNNSANPDSVMAWKNVKTLNYEGHGVGSHGTSHMSYSAFRQRT